MTHQKSIPTKCPTSTCLSEVFPVSRLVLQGSGVDSRTREELCSIILPELSKPKDLQLFSLKTYPVCTPKLVLEISIGEGETYKTILETLSELGYCMEWCVLNSADYQIPQSRKRVFIVGYLDLKCAGKIFPIQSGGGKNTQKLIDGSQGQRVYSVEVAAVTQCAGSGGWGGKTGLYFIDMNPDPKLTENARCITARQDSGISNHKGEHSGVLVEEPRAVINPQKEKTRQNGRRVKEPNEPMFTLTVQDRHGVVHRGRVRKLMPIECWRLQGFTDEQFNKVSALGISEGQLYKMAGNAVSVPVVAAIGKKLTEVIFNEADQCE